jgi:methyl-accepting chemotaxis protein
MEASIFLDMTRADVSKVFMASADSQDAAAAELAEHERLLRDRFASTVSISHGAAIRAALDKEKSAVEDYLGKLENILAVRENQSAAAPLLGDFLQSYQDLRNNMDGLNDQLQAEAQRSQSDAARVVARSKIVILFIGGLSSLLLFIIAFSTARQVHRRLASMTERIRSMSAGDLTQHVPDAGGDEIGEMARWFNQAVDRLHEAIDRVNASAESVSKASQQMQSAAAHTADKAHTQQRQSELVAEAVQQMAAHVQQVSESSRHAAEASEKAGAAARCGGETVQETLREMRQIADSVGETSRRVHGLGQSSEQISEITGAIDDIADQTNLLALNAAIEAAHAGDHGRSFAVVADEVRKLAQRTTEATAEIGQKVTRIRQETRSMVEAINEGSARVGQGVEKTTRAGSALDEIVSIAGVVDEMIGRITSAAEEQSEAASRVTQQITAIAAISSESALASEEAARACDVLNDLALELGHHVGQFTLRAETANSHGRLIAPVPRS